VSPGDVRFVTLDKLDDLYRYEVVDDDTFVWQSGMANWIKLGELLESKADAEPEPIYVQLAPDNVKQVTLEQLGDYFRYGTVDASTLVWTPSTNQWVTLSAALGQTAAPAVVEEPEDPFFVLFGPGDVREVTLEQLDDFYRYDVISESTLLWQKGMSEWKTLGQVAGVEPAGTQAKPVSGQQARATTSNGSATPSPSPSPMTTTATVTAGTSANSTSRASSSARPSPAAPVLFVPSSPPVSFDVEPYAPSIKQRSWTLRLAVAAGLLLTLTRNDVVLAALSPAGLDAKYMAMEQSLVGGPSFGTERAVESLVKSCGGHLEPVRLPITVDQFVSSKSQRRDAAQSSVPTPAPKSESAPPASAAPASDKAATSLAAAMSAQAQAPSHAAPHAQPKAKAAAPSHASSAPKPAKRRGSGKSTLQGGGNYYDPLNAAL
jgi:hypothetical protein